jgi:hypothetical protein
MTAKTMSASHLQLHLIIKGLRVKSGSAAGMMVCSSEDREQIVQAIIAAGFGLVADAKAEALEEASAALERVDRIAATPVNRVTPEEEAEYMEFANSGGDKNWLRNRAAAMRGDS